MTRKQLLQQRLKEKKVKKTKTKQTHVHHNPENIGQMPQHLSYKKKEDLMG